MTPIDDDDAATGPEERPAHERAAADRASDRGRIGQGTQAGGEPAADEGRASREDALVPLAGRLALAIGRINRRIRSSSGGLSHGMLSALATVVRKGPIRAGELARLEVVSAPTLTRALADLEARGFVAREVDPDDRRSFYIVATPTGTELVTQATSERARMIARLLAGITAEDLAKIEQSLDALEAVATAPAS